jgi:Flp pilus assembly protein TadD
LAEAKELLERARDREPQRAEIRSALQGLASAYEKLGLALALQGKGTEAASRLEEACRIDERSASARLNLAVVYAQLGRFAEARASAGQALALQPDYPQARGLLEELRSR